MRRVVRSVPFLLTLCVLGCSKGEETSGPLDDSFEAASPRTLGQRRFVFPAGSGIYEEGDPRRGQSTVVTIGRFNSAMQLAAFSAVSDDGSIEGGYLEVRELCDFATTYRALAGQAPVTPELEGDVLEVASYDSCGIDGDGRLGLYSAYEEVSLISEPSEPAPVEFSTRVALSSSNVGAEPEPDGSASQGAFELTLSANVMSYAMATSGPAVATWSSAHIHRGRAGSNGEIWLSLFDPEIPASYMPLPDAGHIVASTFVSPEQAAVLEVGGQEIYVDAHLGAAGVSSSTTARVGAGVVPGTASS